MKRNTILVLILCLALLMSACGGKTETAEPAPTQDDVPATTAPVEEETEPVTETVPEPTMAPFLEEGKVLLDNDYISITLSGELEESYFVGYELILENKCDQYILVSTDNTSIDGYMNYISLQNATVNPGKKAKAQMQIYTSDENALVKSLADLQNLEGVFRLSFNSDGGNSYTGDDATYPFSINGRQGEGFAAPSGFGLVLLDNDMMRITLGQTFDEEHSFGYEMLLENKSDKYILVSADNTSVDGFMVYLNMQNASVAPGKAAVAQLTAYASSGDIESLDEFINVEGVFRFSTNDNGGNSYRGDNNTYPFAFENASAAVSQQPAESESAAGAESGENTKSESAQAPSAQPIVLGETISCDAFDFTINNVELTYELKPRNTSSFYTSYAAEDGKVYIHIDAEYLNKSKRDICIRDLPIPNADYNDGFCYTGFVVVDDGDNGFDWVSSYVVAEPLTTCHYHGLIECPVIVDETNDALFITFVINGVTYRYDIR